MSSKLTPAPQCNAWCKTEEKDWVACAERGFISSTHHVDVESASRTVAVDIVTA